MKSNPILDPDTTYKNKEWLYRECVELEKPIQQVIETCGVGRTTISRYLRKFNINVKKERIKLGKKGKIVTLETKNKMSIAQTGEKNHFYGKTHTIDTRSRISLKNSGKIHSPEVRTKISVATKKALDNQEMRSKRSKIQKDRLTNVDLRIKLSEDRQGEKNPRWLGGISFKKYCPKFNRDLKRRVRAFFGYQCVLCGKSTEENGKNLDVHHVEYNKNACCDGKRVQFAALCRSCHTKTGSKRENWEEMLHIIIHEVYNDRSYFTKEEWKEIYNIFI